MRKIFIFAAVTVVSALAIGCAQQSLPASAATGGVKATVTAAATPSASTSTHRACANGSPPTSRTLTVTTRDNGKALCATTGTLVVVVLRGTQSDKWTKVRSSSTVLVPRADPRLMLQVGVTGAAFEAVRPGVATVTSSRSACRVPGKIGCGTAMVFRVTLLVAAR